VCLCARRARPGRRAGARGRRSLVSLRETGGGHTNSAALAGMLGACRRPGAKAGGGEGPVPRIVSCSFGSSNSECLRVTQILKLKGSEFKLFNANGVVRVGGFKTHKAENKSVIHPQALGFIRKPRKRGVVFKRTRHCGAHWRVTFYDRWKYGV